MKGSVLPDAWAPLPDDGLGASVVVLGALDETGAAGLDELLLEPLLEEAAGAGDDVVVGGPEVVVPVSGSTYC